MQKLLSLIAVAAVMAAASFTAVSVGQGQVKDLPKKSVKYPRGHKFAPADVRAKWHSDAVKRHDSRIKYLPKATPASFDCTTMGWIGPVQDQGQCGSCWDVSACGVVTNGFIKAGLAKNDGSFILSPQYVLDCGNNGGCNGDDAPTVLDMAKSKGLPTAADYGPYVAGPQRCKYTNQKMYQINDWGFCTPSQQQGIAAVQDIKNCIVAYGALSSAVAANSDWDNYSSGVMPFNRLTPNDVDHDVSIVGWDDTKQAPGAPSAGAWKVLNQWGTSWGIQGYCWIGYGSHQLGTEAAWVTVAALPPPPPPPPTPPTPPVPPGPNPPAPGGQRSASKIDITYDDGSIQTIIAPSAIEVAAIQSYAAKLGGTMTTASPIPTPCASNMATIDRLVGVIEGQASRLTALEKAIGIKK